MRYIKTTQVEDCPYCGTSLPAGVCVCSACGAEHVTVYRPGRWAVATFMLTVVYTSLFTDDVMFSLGFVLAVLVGVCVRLLGNASPAWVR